MKVNWKDVLRRLRAYPGNVHNIRAPCTVEQLTDVESRLGKIPEELSDMLRHFNGAELFINATPFVTVFCITPDPNLSPLGWAPGWFVDCYTSKWRSLKGTQSDWAMAMTNYGGLMLLGQGGIVKEWDTSLGRVAAQESTFDEWIEEILKQGDEYIQD